MAFELILVQAVATPWRQQGRVEGSVPLPPLPQAIADINAAVATWPARELAGVYAPDQDPGQATGAALASRLKRPLWTRPCLAPLDVGVWAGLTWLEVRQRYGRIYRRWHAAPARFAPPLGETLTDVARRLGPLVRNLMHQKKPAVVVAAREVLLALLAHTLPRAEAAPEPPWALLPAEQDWLQATVDPPE